MHTIQYDSVTHNTRTDTYIDTDTEPGPDAQTDTDAHTDTDTYRDARRRLHAAAHVHTRTHRDTHARIRFCGAYSVMTLTYALKVFYQAIPNLPLSTLAAARSDHIDHGSRDRLSAWFPLATCRCASVQCQQCSEHFTGPCLLVQTPSSGRQLEGNGVPHHNGARRADRECWSIANCWSRDSLAATTRGTAVRPQANGGAVHRPASNEALPGRIFYP